MIPVVAPQIVADAGFEEFGAVLSDAHQQAIAHPFGGGLGDHDRLRHEVIEHVEDAFPVEAVTATDRFGRLGIETVGKDRQARPQLLLLSGAQRVAPVDGGPQRLLTGRAVRLPPVSRVNRSSSRSAISLTERDRSRVAASSMASGTPSSHAHNRATASWLSV